MLRGFLGEGLGELFLNAACSSGGAALGFLGRGTWIDQPIFCSASQPRGACTCTSPRRAAIQRATFGPVQTPPSSGGRFSRSRSASSISGVSTATAGTGPEDFAAWSLIDAACAMAAAKHDR